MYSELYRVEEEALPVHLVVTVEPGRTSPPGRTPKSGRRLETGRLPFHTWSACLYLLASSLNKNPMDIRGILTLTLPFANVHLLSFSRIFSLSQRGSQLTPSRGRDTPPLNPRLFDNLNQVNYPVVFRSFTSKIQNGTTHILLLVYT